MEMTVAVRNVHLNNRRDSTGYILSKREIKARIKEPGIWMRDEDRPKIIHFTCPHESCGKINSVLDGDDLDENDSGTTIYDREDRLFHSLYCPICHRHIWIHLEEKK